MQTIKSITILIILVGMLFGILMTTGCQAEVEETQVFTPPGATKAPPPTEMPKPSATLPPPTNTAAPTDTPTPSITPTIPPTDTPTITPTFSPFVLTFEVDEPVKIGYLLWETDPIGIDTLRGIEIAVAQFGGELYGHPIELPGFNEECSDLAGRRGAQMLVRDDAVVGIIGTSCSIAAVRAAPIVTNAGRTLISPSNTEPSLTDPESRAAGYFRTAPSEIFANRVAAQFAFNELNLRKMASLYENSLTMKLRSASLCQAFVELGGECLLERAIDFGTTYMTPLINTILESGADVIYMTMGSKMASLIVSEVRHTPGLEDIAIFGWEGLNTPAILEQAGENAVGMYVATTAFDFDHERNEYQTFLTEYRERFNEDPLSEFHAFAFDAANLLIGAIAAVAVQDEDGSLWIDPLAVRDYLYAWKDFPGLTGLLTCSPQGDCAGIKGGRIHQFTDADPTTFNPGPADSLDSNPSQVWP